jgi:hypothetical protein
MAQMATAIVLKGEKMREKVQTSQKKKDGNLTWFLSSPKYLGERGCVMVSIYIPKCTSTLTIYIAV